MNPNLAADIRLHRVGIIGAWRDIFDSRLDESCVDGLEIPGDLLPALFEEMLALLEGGNTRTIPCFHQPQAICRLVEFPTNISICLKLLKSGEEAIREFLTGASSEFARESEFDRECILWDLNKAVQILIHREIQGICDHSLRPIAEVFGRIRGHGAARRRQHPECLQLLPLN